MYANTRSIEIVEGSVTNSSDNAAHPSGVKMDHSSPQDDSSTENFFFDGVRSHSSFQICFGAQHIYAKVVNCSERNVAHHFI